MIEEDERPHHPPLCKGQDAPDFQETDTAVARGNDQGQHDWGSFGDRVVLDEA
jgi:hypothetical protein